jgi:hypothetical protein
VWFDAGAVPAGSGESEATYHNWCNQLRQPSIRTCRGRRDCFEPPLRRSRTPWLSSAKLRDEDRCAVALAALPRRATRPSRWWAHEPSPPIVGSLRTSESRMPDPRFAGVPIVVIWYRTSRPDDASVRSSRLAPDCGGTSPPSAPAGALPRRICCARAELRWGWGADVTS